MPSAFGPTTCPAAPAQSAVGAETMTRKPRHLHRLFAFFDPLLRCAPLVVQAHHRPAWRLQISHNEPDARKQFAKVPVALSSNLRLGRGSLCTTPRSSSAS